MIFLIPVIGLLCTTLILFWLYPNQVKTGKLSDLYSADSVRTLAGLEGVQHDRDIVLDMAGGHQQRR